MDVIWHYYGGVEVVAFAMIVQAVVEDGVPSFREERNSVGFAEGDEDCPASSLVVGKVAAIFVFSVERAFRHCRQKQRLNATDKCFRSTWTVPIQ